MHSASDSKSGQIVAQENIDADTLLIGADVH
jgi:hypothetical protein